MKLRLYLDEYLVYADVQAARGKATPRVAGRWTGLARGEDRSDRRGQ